MLKKILALFLSIVIITSAFPIETKAKSTVRNNDAALSDSVNTVVFLLKEVFKDRYKACEEEIKDLIRENGYDYSLTMDSFYDQKSPFKGADYVRYLAAYMSCKKYAKENSKDVMLLREIPFLTADTEVETTDEYIPTKIPKYIPSDKYEGEFIYNGDEYILAPTEVEVYERIKNGNFIKTGETKVIEPDKKQVSFLKVTLEAISPDDIFGFMGVERDLVEDDYERRTEMIKRVRTNDAIAQTVGITLPEIDFSVNEGPSEYASYIEDTDGIRKTILISALSLVGKVPYEWGGKAAAPGYDTRWWTYNEVNGLQHGLDCSGFVQWTFMTSGFPNEVYRNMISTKSLLSDMPGRIKKEDLKPGDIGVTCRGEGATNHTGIYIGDGLWCHCSSGKKTVTVSQYGSFSVFFDPVALTDTYDEKVIEDYSKVVSGEENISDGYNISKDIDTYNSVYYTLKYTNEEVLQLARLISLKARGEGINCWTAIAQVMKNRISSDMFPNTLMDVISLEAPLYELEREQPTQEMINISRMVLSGKLKILERSDVLFYYDTRDMGDSETEYEDEETEENLEEEVSEDTFILPDCQYSETIGCYIFYSF